MIHKSLRVLAVWASLFMAFASVASATCRDDSVTLRGDWGQARFTVEIVDDVLERSQGLMFRENLPRSAGMLFVYEHPQRVSFWMKNTLIPLDMIFMDQTGTVQRIKHNAQPGDLTPIPGGDNVLAVLEINGGLARQLGMGPGTEMQHRVFSETNAAWPC